MADNYTMKSDQFIAVSLLGPHMPARRAIAVTPNDNNDVTKGGGDNAPSYASALYVGVAGDISLITAGDNSANGAGTPVLFKAVPVGVLNVQVRRVKATGTTATNIVGLYHT